MACTEGRCHCFGQECFEENAQQMDSHAIAWGLDSAIVGGEEWVFWITATVGDMYQRAGGTFDARDVAVHAAELLAREAQAATVRPVHERFAVHAKLDDSHGRRESSPRRVITARGSRGSSSATDRAPHRKTLEPGMGRR